MEITGAVRVFILYINFINTNRVKNFNLLFFPTTIARILAIRPVVSFIICSIINIKSTQNPIATSQVFKVENNFKVTAGINFMSQ